MWGRSADSGSTNRPVQPLFSFPDGAVCTPCGSRRSSQLFYTLEILQETTHKKVPVSFHYQEYGTDKQLHPRRSPDGQMRQVSPCRTMALNGRCYLSGSFDGYDNLSHYRLNRIADIRLLELPAKDINK